MQNYTLPQNFLLYKAKIFLLIAQFSGSLDGNYHAYFWWQSSLNEMGSLIQKMNKKKKNESTSILSSYVLSNYINVILNVAFCVTARNRSRDLPVYRVLKEWKRKQHPLSHIYQKLIDTHL